MAMRKWLNRAVCALTVESAMLWASAAEAATSIGIGQAGHNLGNQASGLAFMLWMAALLIGFGLVVGGIIKIATAHNNREPAHVGWIMVGFGALLIAVPSVIAMVQMSVFGTSTSGTALGKLGIS